MALYDKGNKAVEHNLCSGILAKLSAVSMTRNIRETKHMTKRYIQVVGRICRAHGAPD